MSITANYPENISNLRHLKKLSPKRRIFSGIDESLDDMPEDDMSGVGMDLPPMQEAPADTGNFDVRANPLIPVDEMGSEEGEGEDNPLYRLGKGLGAMAQGSEEPESSTPPPVDWSKFIAGQRELQPNWNPPAEIASRVPGEMPPEHPADLQWQQGGAQPDVVAPTEAESPEQPVEEQKEPGTYVELGASSEAFSNPKVQGEISRIFGDVTPEMMSQAEDFEKAIDAELKGFTDAEANLDQVQAGLRKRLETRDLTTGQKVAMAIALLAPALVGGVFGGAQGLLGALGGGGEAMSKVLQGREKGFKEDEEALTNLGMQKAKLGMQKLDSTLKGQEIQKKLLQNIGNPKLREIVKDNLGIIKNEEGNDELVIDTGNSMIPLKTSYVRDEHDYKNFKEKTLPQLQTRLGKTKEALGIIQDLDEMLKIAHSQRVIPGGALAKGFIPKFREKMKDPVTGKEIRISEYFETKREQLSDLYGQTVGNMGAKQAPASYREHFLKIMPNPFNFGSVMKGSGDLDTMEAQVRSVKDKFENNLLEMFSASGVETAPIKQLFSSSKMNVSRNEMARDKVRAEEEAAKYM